MSNSQWAAQKEGLVIMELDERGEPQAAADEERARLMLAAPSLLLACRAFLQAAIKLDPAQAAGAEWNQAIEEGLQAVKLATVK